MNQNAQPHSSAWVTFTYASFAGAAFLVAVGVYFLPVDLWIKGYLSMGIIMLIQSCTGSPCVTISRKARGIALRRGPGEALTSATMPSPAAGNR